MVMKQTNAVDKTIGKEFVETPRLVSEELKTMQQIFEIHVFWKTFWKTYWTFRNSVPYGLKL